MEGRGGEGMGREREGREAAMHRMHDTFARATLVLRVAILFSSFGSISLCGLSAWRLYVLTLPHC